MAATPSPIGSVDVHLEPETHIEIDVDPDDPSGHADVFTIDIGHRPGRVVLFFHDLPTVYRMIGKLTDLADAMERINSQRDALLAESAPLGDSSPQGPAAVLQWGVRAADARLERGDQP